jgi:TonB family protein
MFEVYMEGHAVSPQQRAQMMKALAVSLGITLAAGVASLTAGRLSISTVGAPRGQEVLQLSMFSELPTSVVKPPPPPPKKTSASENPAVAAAKMTTRPRRGDPPQGESSDFPTEVVSKNPGSGSDGSDDGDTGIPGSANKPGCIGPMCVPDAPISRVGPAVGTRKARAEPEKAREALSTIKARGIFTPDPSAAALAKTKTGLGNQRSGRVKVEFCVGPSGKVSSSRVLKRFGGDPEVDRVCKAAVDRWRFKPARLAGKARTTCSEVTFDIEFDR